MTDIPKEHTIDATLALYREGYDFIGTRCARFGSDIFETRLLGKKAYCMLGAEAAEMFYAPGRMTRRGALPTSTLRLLQDEGSVATLDDAEHRHRKAMFLHLLTPEKADEIATRAAHELRRTAVNWELRRRVRLHDEFRTILGRTVIRWAGLDLARSERERLIGELAAMIEESGTIGPANWVARGRRRKAEQIVRRQVDQTRLGFIHPPRDCALATVAWHRDAHGHLLTPEVCAVELLNILRPVVAIARFMVFAVDALANHVEDGSRLAEDEDFARSFIQEVRRYYPFFPFLGGIARQPFSWRGREFAAGDFFLLDLYGTNRDPRLYAQPDEFLPERFLDRCPTAFDLIPQGGGDHEVNHRCPGEWVTIAVLVALLQTFVRDARFQLVMDDAIDRSELPASPKRGLLAQAAVRH
ncbi:cytochrome P450 [Jiella marina]|uniref:cytochrome P450 n=1 Tax=Jiella sp. LLJ827 TaxID=2917712 RepID=UPI00210111D6|nr:cytochrome P450 [Jiella sp. LLJ827]MCQ0988605.1 cytochrome P450 [Jiella sp. LLJ827]